MESCMRWMVLVSSDTKKTGKLFAMIPIGMSGTRKLKYRLKRCYHCGIRVNISLLIFLLQWECLKEVNSFNVHRSLMWLAATQNPWDMVNTNASSCDIRNSLRYLFVVFCFLKAVWIWQNADFTALLRNSALAHPELEANGGFLSVLEAIRRQCVKHICKLLAKKNGVFARKLVAIQELFEENCTLFSDLFFTITQSSLDCAFSMQPRKWYQSVKSVYAK